MFGSSSGERTATRGFSAMRAARLVRDVTFVFFSSTTSTP